MRWKIMYEVLKIEKDTKTKALESLRTMLPYVIDTAVLTILYRDAFINADTINVTGNIIIPYIASLIQLYGITIDYSLNFAHLFVYEVFLSWHEQEHGHYSHGNHTNGNKDNVFAIISFFPFFVVITSHNFVELNVD